MNASWTERLKWWVCEKFGHPIKLDYWDYNGQRHYNCACGRIISRNL